MSRRQPQRTQAYRPLRFKQAARGVCPTGKLRYDSAIDAGIALAKAQQSRNTRGLTEHVERRHYFCPQCKGHHLTSRPAA